jgi:hypothetical protein
MSIFYNKYLKYKNKYLQLKNLNNIQFGGELPIIKNYNINLFTDPVMEQHMNPIHGLVLCYTGHIPNHYFLAKSGFIDSNSLGFDITKVIKSVPGTVQPVNKLMKLGPIDYGRFIAIKYIKMKNHGKDISSVSKFIDKINVVDGVDNNYFSLTENNPDIFSIILYCMCWVCNNDEGIKEYYEGIQEIFCLLDEPLTLQPQNNFFETQVISIINTMNEFKVFNQQYAKDFCTPSGTYPDCGEITALNLINLLCWDGTKFDISKLKNPICPLQEFYTVFTNFNLMINANLEKNIFGLTLNARNAWSYLIIHYANYNLRLLKDCKKKYYFELNAGLSTDGKNTNFFQLIKNLLQIDKWEDIINDNVTKIEDKTKKGIGDIEINHSKYGQTIIKCKTGHYFMETLKKAKIKPDLTKLTPEQQNIINTLMNEVKITFENYLTINISSEKLETLFNSPDELKELKIALFKLSLTDKYDDDLRRRMKINVTSNYFNDLLLIEQIQKKEIMNKYTYLCNDFDFISRIPFLTHLNTEINNKRLRHINLRGLSNITSLGNNFLSDCRYIRSINLSDLSNITKIGYDFLANCVMLESIDLSPLSKLDSIGNGFLYGCSNIESIELSPLSKLNSIGSRFLSGCRAINSIELSPLSKITDIGDGFLSDCQSLNSIDLCPLSNITTIGYGFLSDCQSLNSIDLCPLSNITTIGYGFLAGCQSLNSIDLCPLSNITTIEYGFLANCTSLESIDLSCLLNITIIRDDFLSGCESLKSIIIKTEQENLFNKYPDLQLKLRVIP